MEIPRVLIRIFHEMVSVKSEIRFYSIILEMSGDFNMFFGKYKNNALCHNGTLEDRFFIFYILYISTWRYYDPYRNVRT